MDYTYEKLSAMTAVQLREIGHALNHPDLQGIATVHKDKLLPLLCSVLGIEAHAHHQVVGIDKTKVKQEIRALKRERDSALAGKDGAKVREIREKIHHLKRLLRKSTV
ncbi:MAG TPA: hypothetical protein VI932_08480 [Bacteroidota bacterium]|nr:hypothetical protein [Bacteroidota bacterium]